MRRWMLGTAMGLLLTGCGAPGAEPVFRDGPPDWPSGVASQASASVGVLAGEVYMATDSQIDPRTDLPLGYSPLGDGDAAVTIRQPGTRNTWQAAIASGSYRIAGLPTGVALEVTANKFGYQPRTRSVTLSARGQARLSFAYFGGADDSFLLPQPGYQAH